MFAFIKKIYSVLIRESYLNYIENEIKKGYILTVFIGKIKKNLLKIYPAFIPKNEYVYLIILIKKIFSLMDFIYWNHIKSNI